MMNANSPASTTRLIALWLLVFYSLCLLIALITAIVLHATGKPDAGNLWHLVFKDGLGLLAGALATVIGYYFGNRNSDVAFQTAREATEQKITAEKRKDAAEATSESLKNEIANVTMQDDPINAEVSPFVAEDGLTLPEVEQ